ncbi:hypothetical protein AAHE18_09G035100 [Arachis hypogaea]
MDPIKHEDDTCIMLSRIFSTPAFLSLKVLVFYKCKRLSKLPDNIHVLQSLQVLQLQHCYVITSLPKSIKNLQQLTHIYIVSSRLTSEPPKKHYSWFGFHNCTKLDDDAYEAVLKDLKFRIELVANNDGYPHNEANNNEDNEEIVIKGCGIRWMHVHVNHDGEISPDATDDEGYESHDVESRRKENQKKSEFTSWFQRLLLLCCKANTEEEI